MEFCAEKQRDWSAVVIHLLPRVIFCNSNGWVEVGRSPQSYASHIYESFFIVCVALLLDSMISPVDVSAQVVKSLVSHAAHLFGGEWQTPPRAVVGVPARFNKYQREATVRV